MNEREYVLADYQFHPRMMELRFTLIYDNMRKTLGDAVASNLLESTCKSLGADWDELVKLRNKYVDIMRLKRMNVHEFKTQVYIMGKAWEEDMSYICRVFLAPTRQIFYNDRVNAKRLYTPIYYDKLMNQVRVTHSDYQINNLKNLLIDLKFLQLSFS